MPSAQNTQKIKSSRTFLLHLQCLFHMLRYFTSGESHGEALVAFLSGLPAGLPVDQAFVDRELWRRQPGFRCGGGSESENTDGPFLFGWHQGRSSRHDETVVLE